MLKNSIENYFTFYRPFVLPILSRGLEKIILCRLDSFFAKHFVLSESQLGFKKGRSTESVLLLRNEIVLHNIENKRFKLGNLIDISKVLVALITTY